MAKKINHDWNNIRLNIDKLMNHYNLTQGNTHTKRDFLNDLNTLLRTEFEYKVKSEDILKKFEKKCCKCRKKSSFLFIIKKRFRIKHYCFKCYNIERKD